MLFSDSFHVGNEYATDFKAGGRHALYARDKV